MLYPLMACSGVPKAGLDQDGDKGRDRALFCPIRQSRISPSGIPALLPQVSVRESTCGWINTWIFHGAEAPSHLLLTYFTVFAKTLIEATKKKALKGFLRVFFIFFF